MASTLELTRALAPEQPELQPPSGPASPPASIPLQPAQSGDHGPKLDDLMRAIVAQESSGNPKARGKQGEVGLMQIEPSLAQSYGVDPAKLSDPATNLYVGRRYLEDLWKRYGGNVNLVLTAYNAGPHRADTGVTPASTKKYISSIWNRLGSAIEGTAYADELPPALKGAHEVDAPWTPTAMAVASPVANPWAGSAQPWKTGIETGYEQYVRDPAMKAISGTVNKIAPGFGQTAAGIVPENLTGAGVDLGLMATGLGEMGLLARLTIPAMGGAVGAYASGASPTSGSLQGAGSALGGEIIGGIAGVAGRGLLSKGITGKTTPEVGAAVGSTIGKRLGMIPPKDAGMFERTFMMGGAKNQADRIAKSVSQQAEQSLRGRLLDIGIGHPVHLREAEDIIEALNEQTYTAVGSLKNIQGRGAMSRMAFEARASVERTLNSVQPGLGTVWRQSRRDVGATKVLQRLFRERGVFENGHMDQAALEKLVSGKYWDQLVNTLGPEDSVKLLRTIRRGEMVPGARDIAGRGISPHVGLGGHVRLGLPHTTKPAGVDLPSIIRPAATNPARIPGGIGTNQTIDWFNRPLDQK